MANTDDKNIPESDRTIEKGKDGSLEGLPLPSNLRLYLKILEGAETGRDIIIREKRAVIGRNEGDILIEDENISRKHAVIEVLSAENIFLRDLASTNGTFVNESQISQVHLKDGDIIGIGNTKMRFVLVQE
jgi:pSer/pThr/pTyr-binding forkhead associated (FHA) protein